jgi:hypothetical protein
MPTDTSAPLPEMDMPEGTTITVTCNDPAAVITQLVVHGNQEAGPNIEDFALQDVYVLPVASEISTGLG